MTELSSLPNEMLVAIFEHLTPADLFACMNVCRTWRNLVDEVKGLVLYIGNGVEEIWKSFNVKFRSIKHIAQFGVSKAFFSELGAGDTAFILKTPVKFKYPYLLKKLWVDGNIVPAVFNQISKDLPNLQKLTFHISTLSAVPMKNLELNFGTLTSLNITMYKDEVMQDTNHVRITENLINLMTRPFVYSSLTKLTIHLPFIAAEALNMTQAIVHFMIRHKHSLRHVFLSLDGDGIVNEMEPGPAHAISDQEVVGMKFQSFALHSSMPNHVSMQNLRRIMKRQKELRSMYCTTGYNRLFSFRRVFRSSASTLTSIQLAVAVELDGSGVDLALLASCKSLKVLALLGPEKEEEDEAENATEDVFGITKLPNSLQVFKLFNLFVQSQEISSMTQKPNLRVLQLDNVGTFGNLGITLQDVTKVMGTKQLKSFLFKDCINISSIEEARNGTDPNLSFCAVIARNVHLHENEGLRGYWNERLKYYELESTNKEPEVLPSDHPEFVLANGDQIFTMTDEAEDDAGSDDDPEEADDEVEIEVVEEEAEDDEDEAEDAEEAEDDDEDHEEMDVDVENEDADAELADDEEADADLEDDEEEDDDLTEDEDADADLADDDEIDGDDDVLDPDPEVHE